MKILLGKGSETNILKNKKNIYKRIRPKSRGPKTIDIIKNRRLEQNNRNLFNLKIRRQEVPVRLLFKKNIRNKNPVRYLRQKIFCYNRNN